MNEEEKINPGHTKNRKTLRIIGPILIVTGALCLLISLIDFFLSMGSMRPPYLMILGFLGVPLLPLGFFLTTLGFMGKFARYQAGEVAPVAKDTFNYMADGTQEGVQTAAKAVGQGLAEGIAPVIATASINTDSQQTEKIRCYKCNYAETLDAQFCSNCGTALQKSKSCPVCSELNDPDAKFCDNCGKPMNE